MIKYKDVEIEFSEFEKVSIGEPLSFQRGLVPQDGYAYEATKGIMHKDYTVKRGTKGLVFCAESRYGVSYALNSTEALEGAKKLIDAKVR